MVVGLQQQLAAAMQAVQQNPTDTAAMTQLARLTELLESYRKGLSLLAGGKPTTITEGKIWRWSLSSLLSLQ